jgi:hypothetical protein
VAEVVLHIDDDEHAVLGTDTVFQREWHRNAPIRKVS